MASPFVDKVTISISAGKGGDGAVSFHREKYVAAGGPDGGDGGRGGDVIFRVDPHMNTLMDFRYKRKFTAGNGAPGGGKRCTGRDGESIVLRVPVGTVIRDADTGAIMHDMSSGEDFVACRGGRGGWGNKRFATATRQTPRFAKPGLPGEAHTVLLELKLLADVGLVGFPNVGKSTLLSVVSNAHPKIANYHFTTLFPNLGVVYVGEGQSFVLADIPGIIEGASEGAGLGHDFLRHIDRCRLLIHLVDVSGSEGRDPKDDFEKINTELANFSQELSARPQIVLGNKCDIASPEQIAEFRAFIEEKGLVFLPVSAATRQGLDKLPGVVYERLQQLPPVTVYEPEYVRPDPALKDPRAFEIARADDGAWDIDAPWLENILEGSDVSDYESLQYFQRQLMDSGVIDRLVEMGVQENDTIRIGEFEFDYVF